MGIAGEFVYDPASNLLDEKGKSQKVTCKVSCITISTVFLLAKTQVKSTTQTSATSLLAYQERQDPIKLAGGMNLYQYAPNALGLKLITVYHYTSKAGYNGISSQKPHKFRASQPIKGHPKDVSVTTRSPEEVLSKPNGFKKLRLTSKNPHTILSLRSTILN